MFDVRRSPVSLSIKLAAVQASGAAYQLTPETASGDPERYWTDVADDLALKNGESIIFEASNRNKKGICLDIHQKRGRDIFERLIGQADVFLTNLRGSTTAKLGIDYETIAGLNSKIIYAGVSGYGPKGPMSDLGAFDPLGQARSGWKIRQGGIHGRPKNKRNRIYNQ